jgi:hypothetical protein
LDTIDNTFLEDLLLKKLGLFVGVRAFGIGVLSQNVSGTKKKRKVPENATTMATILASNNCQYIVIGSYNIEREGQHITYQKTQRHDKP